MVLVAAESHIEPHTEVGRYGSEFTGPRGRRPCKRQARVRGSAERGCCNRRGRVSFAASGFHDGLMAYGRSLVMQGKQVKQCEVDAPDEDGSDPEYIRGHEESDRYQLTARINAEGKISKLRMAGLWNSSVEGLEGHYLVKVWTVDGPNRIWVSLENPQTDRQEVLRQWERLPLVHPRLRRLREQEVYNGAPALWWDNAKGFRRVIIIRESSNPRAIPISSGDWALTSTVDHDDLFILPMFARRRPRQLTACGLAGIRPCQQGGWSDDAIAAPQKMVGRRWWMELVHVDDYCDAAWMEVTYDDDDFDDNDDDDDNMERTVADDLVEAGLARRMRHHLSFSRGESGGQHRDRSRRIKEQKYLDSLSASPASPSPPASPSSPASPTSTLPLPEESQASPVSPASLSNLYATTPLYESMPTLPTRHHRRQRHHPYRFECHLDSAGESAGSDLA